MRLYGIDIVFRRKILRLYEKNINIEGNQMKKILLIIISILLTFLLAGCGGNNAGTGAGTDTGTGTLTLTVSWPTDIVTPLSVRATRVPPSAAYRIVVTARRQFSTLKEATITCEAGQSVATGTLTDLTPGLVILTAMAYDSSNALLASGMYTVTVVAGASVPAAISLTAEGGSGGLTGATLFATKINPIDGATMIWIPGSTFTMGSPFYANCGTPPTQEVTLSGYWIYKYDVTVSQYRAFSSATGYVLPPFPSGYSWSGKSGWDDPLLQQHPIVNVSLDDCVAYVDWAGVTLPTEAQWEYAARGPSGNNYPWGGTATSSDTSNGWDQSKCANFGNSYSVGKSTWSVDSFQAGVSWCGAQDMAGNVWQWCGDWYGNYSSTPITNPTGPASGTRRVIRGGSWNYGSYNSLRGAFRNYSYSGPSNYGTVFGFRCAVSSPGP